MNVAYVRCGVRRSVLGWLQRLDWNLLDECELAPLRGEPGSALLEKRLLPWLRRFRFAWNGKMLPLSPSSHAAIIDRVDTCCSLDWAASSGAVRRLLIEGVRTEQTVPDGGTVSVQVPLLDWANVHRNHWDVADAATLPGAHAGNVCELVGYVNGIPLVVLACVGRDRYKRWGTVSDGIEHLWRGMTGALPNPPPLHAQLLLSLDRRGGRYAAVGTPQHAWVRWREDGWDRNAQAQLRERPVPFAAAPLDPPWSVHAELLCGVVAPARLMQLLRGFMREEPTGRTYLARPGQFFAVQCALQALRYRDAAGRRRGGQLCLAAGSGLERARHWLLQALHADPVFAGLRVLVPASRVPPPAPERRRRTMPAPADLLVEFLAGRTTSPQQVPLRALRGWARKASLPATGDGDGDGDGDIVLLVDADFWATEPAVLRRLRRCLPQAAWLTVTARPIAPPSPDLDPGEALYTYPPVCAVADDVVVPAWRDSGLHLPAPHRDLPADAAPCPRVTRIAVAIGQHFHGVIRMAERHLRGALLVESAQEAQDYHTALEADGRLQTCVVGYNNQGLPAWRGGDCAMPEADVLITYGDLPATQDARLGVLYVDKPLSEAERMRAVGLINAPHPEKRAALLVDFHAGHDAAAASDWLPLPVKKSLPALAVQHRRLHGLLPAGADHDFHACRDHLAPDWALDPAGDDIDMHRRRRDLLHHRVTAFGQRLQVAIASEATLLGGMPALGRRYRSALHRYSLLRDAVSEVALESTRFDAEDLRVRHWAREQAPEVREQPLDYLALRAGEPMALPAQQVNRLYTRLRRRLEAPGEEPHLADPGHHALRQVLAGTEDAEERLKALRALEAVLEATLKAALPGSPGARAVSRGLALLSGLFDMTLHQADCVMMGARIDGVVAQARKGPPELFQAHVRDELEALLRGQLEETQINAIVHAVLARASHWPPD